MRTAIDIDESLLTRLHDDAHREGVTFRALLHRVLQRGLDISETTEARYQPPAFSMGHAREGVDLVKARWLADALDDEEMIRKMADGR